MRFSLHIGVATWDTDPNSVMCMFESTLFEAASICPTLQQHHVYMSAPSQRPITVCKSQAPSFPEASSLLVRRAYGRVRQFAQTRTLDPQQKGSLECGCVRASNQARAVRRCGCSQHFATFGCQRETHQLQESPWLAKPNRCYIFFCRTLFGLFGEKARLGQTHLRTTIPPK